MRRFRFGRAATFAAITLILSAQSAWAENLDLDGDGAAPVSGNTMAFGTVCAGTASTKAVIFQVHKNGNDHFADGATVSIAMTSASGGLASSGTSIVLPGNWSGLANGTTRSATATASVTLTATGAGGFSGLVAYTASGPKAGGGTLTDSNTLAVTATVVGCDSTPPVLNLPAPITAEATGPGGAAVTYTATATDANPASPAVTCVPASGSTFAIATTTVNCSATDTAGNTANGSFTVTVQDTIGPAIVGTPAAQSAEASGPAGAVVTYDDPTATDVVDGPRPVSCVPPSGSTFALGTTTVTCSSSDTRSNTTSTTFTVTVSDSTAPVLILPSDILAEATSAAGAGVTFSASAIDIVDGPIAPVCSAASGDTFGLGTTTVSCTATDEAGNSAGGSFDITVEDTTPPDVSVPPSFSAEAGGPSGAAVRFAASATDLVDGPLAPTCLPASGSTFALGATTVTCSATDAAGNAGSASFVVTVVDTTPPDLGLPADQLVEATGPGGAVATFAATATDLVDGSIEPVCSRASGSTFALGSTLVTCTATDAAGNVATGSFTILVVDTTPPAITVPADVTADPTSLSGAVVTYGGESATDIVDGPLAVACVPPSGSSYGFGPTTVTCSATDAAGNTGTGTFTVTVNGLTFGGFYQPVDMAALNTVKNGSTVPVKWELFGAGGLEFTSTAAVVAGWPRTQKVDCGSLGTLGEDAIETTATGGTSLRYDGTAGQYIYNWQTPKQAGTCWRLDVKFVDGSTKSANFKLK